MQLTETIGDVVLIANEGTSIAQCISSDIAMGAGIAKAIEAAFHIRGDILGRCTPDMLTVGNVVEIRREVCPGRIISIFNVITKPKAHDKPTYETLRLGLERLGELLSEYSRVYGTRRIPELAIPRLGCGLDGLQWDVVRPMVQKTLCGNGTHVCVYVLK